MIELSPLVLADAIAWVSENLLGIGISTTAVILVVLAFEGRKAVRAGSILGRWAKVVMLALGLIGILLGLGIITGINADRAVELARMAGEAIGGFL